MTLLVTINGHAIATDASNLQIRSTTTGYASVSFNLNRKLDDSLLAPFTDVLVYDTATGEQVGGGRLMEQGRNLDDTWLITCLGEGLASMQDRTFPMSYIDANFEHWTTFAKTTKRLDTSQTVQPGTTDGTKAIVLNTSEGIGLADGSSLTIYNRLFAQLGLRIGLIACHSQSGVSVASGAGFRFQVFVGTSSNPVADNLVNDPWQNTVSARIQRTYPTHFVAGRDIPAIRWAFAAAAGSGIGENHWSAARDMVIRSQIYGSDGVIKTTGYTNEYVTIGDVFIDWLVRAAPRLDVGNASIVSGTYRFTQLTYMDGVNGMTLLDDCMAMEPDIVWAVWEKNDNGKWNTELKRLPTTVRYEASVDDGFNAPTPSTEIYNRAVVTGRDYAGNYRRTVSTQTVPALDDVGLVREDTTAVNASAWSPEAAQATGDVFLANHKVPPNAGTLTIARPIQDYTTGRWIRPAHIRPGELIRVRGVQPTPDTLNATSPDGVTVFRIVSMTYSDDTGAATLELDSLKLTQQRAVAQSYLLWMMPQKAVKNPKFGTRNPLR